MTEMWSFIKHTLRSPILWGMIVLTLILIPLVFALSYALDYFVGGDNLRDLFITLAATLVALILVAFLCIASATIVLSIFDWLMGTAYMTAANVGIGALVVLIMLRMMR